MFLSIGGRRAKYNLSMVQRRYGSLFYGELGALRLNVGEHASGKHFTAGNTTMNRIESNWIQMKLFVGKETKTRRNN
ncbi:LOW QUALITY PROTEIN: hypothetical protein PHMEG_00025172 [Phytophthora megakarya]|uniref:Uncharacterized protein n=1 Tax=Phytophthora megakarya TaxID=4795 RepID=A0A225VEB2_9STRA|nr:LOW QUALITY PROTEIN: hypothetical protein PHMEG_00025172 [Phytophthora megakarya]